MDIYNRYFHTFSDEEFDSLIKDNDSQEQNSDDVMSFVRIEIDGNIVFNKDFTLDFSQLQVVIKGGAQLLEGVEFSLNFVLQNDTSTVTLLTVKGNSEDGVIKLGAIEPVKLADLNIGIGRYKFAVYLTDSNGERISVTIGLNSNAPSLFEMLSEQTENLGRFSFLNSVTSKLESTSNGCFYSVESNKTYVENSSEEE